MYKVNSTRRYLLTIRHGKSISVFLGAIPDVVDVIMLFVFPLFIY